ncbi:MAG: hypothetical protein V4484_18565 [Pseudomonadota bacterium]
MHITVLSMRSMAAIAALALSGSAFAAGQNAQEGQTVFKDPVSGKMRNPTAAQAKELNDLRAAQRAADAAERKASGAPMAGVARLQGNGIVAAHVDEESISYSVMKRNGAGELVLECVQGASAVEKTLATPVTTDSKEHQHDVQ